MNYVAGLLAFIALCAGWAVFQVWLAKYDPEANQRLRKCGECNCDDDSKKACRSA
jgi:hypothetical protein